jgi:hemerythrin
MDLKWKKEYETGFEEIDNQHRSFFRLFERLYSIVPKSNNEDEIMDAVNDLKSYTLYHFKTEEELFSKFNYEETDKKNHLEKHQKLCETIRKFENEDTISPGILGYKLVDFTQKWLVEHILSTDMKFVNFIKNQK